MGPILAGTGPDSTRNGATGEAIRVCYKDRMSMTNTEFRAARKRLGMTQRELAAALGMNPQTIVNMEAAHPNQPIKQVTALAVECLLRRAGRFDDQLPAQPPQIAS